jgi:hypothetical protein
MSSESVHLDRIMHNRIKLCYRGMATGVWFVFLRNMSFKEKGLEKSGDGGDRFDDLTIVLVKERETVLGGAP